MHDVVVIYKSDKTISLRQKQRMETRKFTCSIFRRLHFMLKERKKLTMKSPSYPCEFLVCTQYEVMSDLATMEKEYPLLVAVNRAASSEYQACSLLYL